MSHAKRLGTASGLLFFSGFMLSKLQYLPYPIVAAGFRFFSLGLYLAAYGTWFVSSYLQNGHSPLPNKWYGFAKIKEQFLFSSFVGFCATVLSVAAVFVPILFPPAAWLFAIGNAIWAIGEYHKLNNPPQNKDFSYTRQQAYFKYSVCTTSISLVAALAATFIFVFPPFTLPITIFSVLLCVGLGALTFEYWLESNFGDHKPGVPPNSYKQMGDDFGPTVSPTKEHSPAPVQTQNLFHKSEPEVQFASGELNQVEITKEQDSHLDCSPL